MYSPTYNGLLRSISHKPQPTPKLPVRSQYGCCAVIAHIVLLLQSTSFENEFRTRWYSTDRIDGFKSGMTSCSIRYAEPLPLNSRYSRASCPAGRRHSTSICTYSILETRSSSSVCEASAILHDKLPPHLPIFVLDEDPVHLG